MVAIGNPADVANLYPACALRAMRAMTRRRPAGLELPRTTDPDAMTHTGYGWVEEPRGGIIYDGRALGRGARPIPLAVARAWSEAW